MKGCVNATLSAHELRERDFRQSILNNLVQALNHWTYAAVARVNANFKDTRVALAVRCDFISV